MRVPVPSHINWKFALMIVAGVMVAQQAVGTDPLFTLLTGLYLSIYFIAFNACKGLLNPSGGWIFFFGLSTGVIGLIFKATLGEPGQTHLVQPTKTMFVYCVGLAACGFAAALGHRLAPKAGLLTNMAVGEQMQQAAIGCFVVGTVVTFVGFNVAAEGSVISALRQFNNFNRMAIILATIYEVRRSGGRRSANWVVFAAGSVIFFIGLVTFSKEGILIPFVTWLLPAVTAGANFTRKQLIGGALVGFFLIYYMVPYSQYGRRSRGDVVGARTGLATISTYLLDLNGTRAAFLALDQAYNLDAAPHFYDQSEGFLDRENMLAFDDALIANTDDGNVFGLSPTIIAYINIIPHFLWPNKPALAAGNSYARGLGVIGQDDETTGISFSPVGDAYHQAKWVGVLIVLPLVVFLYAFLNDAVTGSVINSPWALLAVALAANSAPQGLLQSTVYLSTDGIINIVGIALLTRYVVPIFARFLLGKERVVVRRSINFRPGNRNANLERLASEKAPGTI